MSRRSNIFRAAAAGLLGAMVLSACETAEGYRQRTALYVGAPSDTLILDWGQPVAVDTLSDGSEVWTYFVEERHVREGYYRTVPREERVTYIDEDGYERTRIVEYEDTVYEPPREWWEECETRFVISPKGVVTDFRFDGSGCRATEIED